MRIFLDFEASSLGVASYPIEVGWAGEDGSTEAHLIAPAPGWTDWDDGAQAIHGLSRERLIREGEPHGEVAARALAALSGHAVFVSAPTWDGKWMSVLLRAAGLPRHALRLRDTEEAFREAAAEALSLSPEAPDFDEIVGGLIARAQLEAAAGPVAHRALADACAELTVWRKVVELAGDFPLPQGGRG